MVFLLILIHLVPDKQCGLATACMSGEGSWVQSTASEDSLGFSHSRATPPSFLPTRKPGLAQEILPGPMTQVCVGDLMRLVFPEV